MARLGISTGTTPNDGTGDTLLSGAVKINSNFAEIYGHFGDGNSLTSIGGTWSVTSVGIHTLKNVGIGTTDPISTLTVRGNVLVTGTGIITATSFSGNATSASYSTTAGIATYATSSGIATYATTSGISTSVIGGIGSITQLNVSGIATIGPVAAGTTSLYLGGPLKVGEIDISGGSNSVHVGQGAGRKNYNGGSGQQNTAVGYNALGVNQASNFNTAFGISALGALGDTAFNNYEANTAIGAYAGTSLLTGQSNTFLGRSAGGLITSGSHNTILGRYDGNSGGLDIRTSSNNVVIADGTGNIRFYTNSSGNTGIGTTNPTQKLDVDGSVKVGINTSQGVILTSPNGTKYQLFVENDGTLKTVAV